MFFNPEYEGTCSNPIHLLDTMAWYSPTQVQDVNERSKKEWDVILNAEKAREVSANLTPLQLRPPEYIVKYIPPLRTPFCISGKLPRRIRKKFKGN